MIDVECWSCGAPYTVPEERAGRRFRCRSCGSVVQVPDDDDFFDAPEEAVSDDWDDSNPYAASGSPGRNAVRGGRGRLSALNRTKWPAFFLFGCLALSLINRLLIVPDLVAGNPPNLFGPPNGMDQTEQMVGAIIGLLIGFGIDLVVLLGAISMLRLSSYSMAMAGAICGCIPCCGPAVVLAIPFSIWGLVVINQPDVKRHFRSTVM